MTSEQSTPAENLGEQRLDAAIMDYARAGFTLTSRTTRSAIMENGEKRARLSLDDQDKVVIEGAPFSGFAFDGRMRAWLLLLILLIAVFGSAWLLGIFRF